MQFLKDMKEQPLQEKGKYLESRNYLRWIYSTYA